MRAFLKWGLVGLVLVYAAWIAYPVVKSFFLPDYGPQVPSMSMDDSDYSGGLRGSLDYDSPDSAQSLDSLQGEAAVEAMADRNVPVVVLWAAVIGFYLIAAFLHANGNLRATLAYGLGFVADLVLTFATGGGQGQSLTGRIVELLAGWDPRYVITLAALVLGFLIYMSRQKPEDRITGIRSVQRFLG